MINGIGFDEILVIGVIVLLLFGAEGISGIMRDLGKWVGSLKKYRDEFTRELLAISEPHPDEQEIKRNERERIRKSSAKSRRDLSPEEREQENSAIFQKITALEAYKNASSIFCYLSVPDEVLTDMIVEHAIKSGKKVFVPYCIKETREIRLAPVSDVKSQVKPGTYNVPEPVEALRVSADPMLVDLFIIPGTAFDHALTRLGRGKGYFDRFLSKIKGKKQILALAFNQQIYPYVIPAEAHDIKPDMVISPRETITEASA